MSAPVVSVNDGNIVIGDESPQCWKRLSSVREAIFQRDTMSPRAWFEQGVGNRQLSELQSLFLDVRGESPLRTMQSDDRLELVGAL
jgi:hypothetical protein